MDEAELNASEWDLLRWLGKSEMTQYGECHGANLDVLVTHGLAEIVGEKYRMSNDSIAKGSDLMYRGVRLSAAGRATLKLTGK